MAGRKKLSSARAVADVTSGVIFASVEIAAPPERVFTALTSAEDVVKWWGSDAMYRTTEWTMPLTPGAAWRSSGRGADGVPFAVEGEVVEVDPPRKLVWTWRAPWDGGNTTTITYRLEPIEGGTRVSIRHEGFGDRHESCRGHTEGWERVLGWLSIHAPFVGDSKYFFFKLVPPRTSFLSDMTAVEGAAMKEHADYWRAQATLGTAMVFGPVADPSGVWGLGTVEVASAEDARALADADPVIRANLGFRFEMLPILSVITRD
jgi:uncharacterized protein YndB with AHSA1/START domain